VEIIRASSFLEGSSEPIIDMPESLPDSISLEDAVRLGAVDSLFYAHTFFPRSFRQNSPLFHSHMFEAAEDPTKRYVNIKAFRGSAKTTLLRTFLSKRIAYQITRTALFIGPNEPSAARSIQWLRGQVERNKLWSSTFGLEPGKKWHETEVEIKSRVNDYVAWIMGVGITGSLRGINFDDYRPDLIILDDVLTDENVLTSESRGKVVDLILNAVAKSLSREEVNAKLIMLQTPLHAEDASAVASTSPLWTTLTYSCWTPETEDLPDSSRRSSWEELFPTSDLQKEKSAAAEMGKLSGFLREMECKIISSETSSFKTSLLNFYDEVPRRGVSVLAIDPVPPPSARELAKNLQGKDFEAMVVWTRSGGNYYLRHYEQMKGHDPSWTLAKAFELAIMFRVSYIAVDAVAYQAVLKWLLEKEMQRRGQYFTVIPDKGAGKKSKYQKIVDAHGSLLQYRKLFVSKTHTEFLSAFTEYPTCAHDDLLDASAIGLRALVNPSIELGESEYTVEDEKDIEPLHIRRRIP
jgi:phage terminase large subunit-like protein